MTSGGLAKILNGQGRRVWRTRTTALDALFSVSAPRAVTELVTDATLVELARLFEGLEYSGLPLEQVRLVQENGMPVSLRSVDSPAALDVPFDELSLLVDPANGETLDPRGLALASGRQRRLAPPRHGDHCPPAFALCEAARLVARYGFDPPPGCRMAPGAAVDPRVQRELLHDILAAPHVARALRFLLDCGFVAAVWPEVQALVGVDHDKDFHPEGDVWQHTLQALEHASGRSVVLSLGVLLHDIGKPRASGCRSTATDGRLYPGMGRETRSAGTRERPFDGHAEIGAGEATKFLRRLGFDRRTQEAVTYLVRYHMLPAALEDMPLSRTEPVLASEFFPLLLEVYEADSSASFRPPDDTRAARNFYQRYLKNRRNPWRNPDGTLRRS